MPVPQRAGRPHHASFAHPLCGRCFVFNDILALFWRFWCFAGVLLCRTFCPSVEPHDLTQFLCRAVVRLRRRGGSRTAPTLACMFLAHGQQNSHLAVNRPVEARFLPQQHLPSLPRRSQAGVPLDRVLLLLHLHLLLERRPHGRDLLLQQAQQFPPQHVHVGLAAHVFVHVFV